VKVSLMGTGSGRPLSFRRLPDLTLIELTVFICSQPDILMQSSRGYPTKIDQELWASSIAVRNRRRGIVDDPFKLQ
jgi:hypothetical protein